MVQIQTSSSAVGLLILAVGNLYLLLACRALCNATLRGSPSHCLHLVFLPAKPNREREGDPATTGHSSMYCKPFAQQPHSALNKTNRRWFLFYYFSDLVDCLCGTSGLGETSMCQAPLLLLDPARREPRPRLSF
ncbi:hypothetical protein LZ31DRAFT_10988 [Colletotrichum somersetense]|nr:hypothetical protein LZ31DRAFT_10988 [Colletotrichum somersetense]